MEAFGFLQTTHQLVSKSSRFGKKLRKEEILFNFSDLQV